MYDISRKEALDILELVDEKLTVEKINSAYRKSLLKNHPDKRLDDNNFNNIDIHKIQIARDTLLQNIECKSNDDIISVNIYSLKADYQFF